jgi:hypothetical protein
MYLIVLLGLFFSLPASGKTLLVEVQNQKYQLSFDANSIRFVGKNADLSLRKKQCNKHVINQFVSSIERHIRATDLQKPNALNNVKVTSENISSFYSIDSIAGQFFKTMSDEIKEIKVEELINCKS